MPARLPQCVFRFAVLVAGLSVSLAFQATAATAFRQSPTQNHGPEAGQAERALLEGRVDDAISLLNTALAASPKDGSAHLLLCRAFYSEEVSDDAVTHCEAALADGLGASSFAHDWMGRAYGLKASRATLSGYSLAKKVRVEFEAAVAADPRNADAADDLSEFYINAPGLVGGGVDKALALADRVQNTLPQAAHRMRGLAAEQRGDDATAERELRAAVGVAGKPGAWVDLAAFFGKRKRYDEAVATLRKAEEADRARDDSLVDIAGILLDIKRNYPDGIRLLKLYLGSPARSDAGPACKAHTLLGKLLQRGGDKAAARNEYNAALKLASRYEPAQKGLNSL